MYTKLFICLTLFLNSQCLGTGGFCTACLCSLPWYGNLYGLVSAHTNSSAPNGSSTGDLFRLLYAMDELDHQDLTLRNSLCAL